MGAMRWRCDRAEALALSDAELVAPGLRLVQRSAVILALLAVLLGSLVLAGLAPAAEVTRFSPQGTVKQVRQASATFSEPMVAFGDPAAADPFDVTCPVPGQGRWVDTGQWVYDFERDLPAGIRCAFRLRAGLVTLGGQALTGNSPDG